MKLITKKKQKYLAKLIAENWFIEAKGYEMSGYCMPADLHQKILENLSAVSIEVGVPESELSSLLVDFFKIDCEKNRLPDKEMGKNEVRFLCEKSCEKCKM